MINLNDKYALLKNGDVEPLFYGNGEPRDAYEEAGVYYLDHDVAYGDAKIVSFALRHDEIIMTSDDRELLDKIGKALGQKSEEQKKKDWRNLVRELGGSK